MNSVGGHPSLRITQLLQYFRPTVHPVHVRRPQVDPQLRILPRHRCPVALPAEHVRSRHEPPQVPQLQRPQLRFLHRPHGQPRHPHQPEPRPHLVPRQHRADPGRVPVRQPFPLRVFIHHEHVPIAVGAAEQARRVVRIPVTIIGIICSPLLAIAGVATLSNGDLTGLVTLVGSVITFPIALGLRMGRYPAWVAVQILWGFNILAAIAMALIQHPVHFIFAIPSALLLVYIQQPKVRLFCHADTPSDEPIPTVPTTPGSIKPMGTESTATAQTNPLWVSFYVKKPGAWFWPMKVYSLQSLKVAVDRQEIGLDWFASPDQLSHKTTVEELLKIHQAQQSAPISAPARDTTRHPPLPARVAHRHCPAPPHTAAGWLSARSRCPDRPLASAPKSHESALTLPPPKLPGSPPHVDCLSRNSSTPRPAVPPQRTSSATTRIRMWHWLAPPLPRPCRWKTPKPPLPRAPECRGGAGHRSKRVA